MEKEIRNNKPGGKVVLDLISCNLKLMYYKYRIKVSKTIFNLLFNPFFFNKESDFLLILINLMKNLCRL